MGGLRLFELVRDMRGVLSSDAKWCSFFDTANRIHLAVLVEPFLTFILDGRKTIESRFAFTRVAPFRRISIGDLVLLKRSSGPVIGVARVGPVEFFELSAVTWPKVRALSASLCVDDEFWRARQKKRYATLLTVDAVRAVDPLSVEKKDRRAWVILRDQAQRCLQF